MSLPPSLTRCLAPLRFSLPHSLSTPHRLPHTLRSTRELANLWRAYPLAAQEDHSSDEGAPCPNPETRNPKPETRNPRAHTPRAHNPKPQESIPITRNPRVPTPDRWHQPSTDAAFACDTLYPPTLPSLHATPWHTPLRRHHTHPPTRPRPRILRQRLSIDGGASRRGPPAAALAFMASGPAAREGGGKGGCGHARGCRRRARGCGGGAWR
jgi:hypothetical protein